MSTSSWNRRTRSSRRPTRASNSCWFTTRRRGSSVPVPASPPELLLEPLQESPVIEEPRLLVVNQQLFEARVGLLELLVRLFQLEVDIPFLEHRPDPGAHLPEVGTVRDLIVGCDLEVI